MTTSEKTCFKCKRSLPIESFYRHAEMADGHLNKCKECTRGDVKQYRRSDKYREKVLSADRARGNRQCKAYRDKHKAQRESEYKARQALSNALRDKKIVRPVRCQHCGSDSALHGHHHDYSKPLSVVWLCVPCHRQIHAFMDLVNKANESAQESP